MFLYNLVINLYGFIIRIASAKNLKARQWIKGRECWREDLIKKITALQNKDRVWVHCASYGEFEQGRPLIEAIKKDHSSYSIVLSFFSPSGYEAFKDWKGADLVCYLPLDTKKNARDFLRIADPKVAVFIKYEFWVNFLIALKKQNIPTYLVSAVFKPHHPFFKWYGSLFKRSLKTFRTMFIQDEGSAGLLETIGIKDYVVSGDTRFDRVIEIRDNFSELPFIKEFCGSAPVLVAGSTWPADEEVVLEAYKIMGRQDLKLIIVPHQVEEKDIDGLKNLLEKSNLGYSLFSDQKNNGNASILVVDKIGILSKIYHYASVVYIGGGLNDGIHNCLEPAVYYKPVIFYGNDYHKFNEATELLELGAAKNILSASGLASETLGFLDNKNKLAEIEKDLELYFRQKSGTTKKVLASLNLN